MILRNLMELIFPSNIYCIACGAIIDSSRPYALCDNCMRTFRWADGRTCDKCGKILQDTYLHDICIDCRENERSFTKGYACVQYGIHERDVLLSFKYGGKAYIGAKLAEIMADRLAGEIMADRLAGEIVADRLTGEIVADRLTGEIVADRPAGGKLSIDLVLPVPMHKKKQKARGFNQADIVGRRLAARLSVPYAARLLLRTKPTPAMSRLSPQERRDNMEGVFAVAPGGPGRVAGKDILLVDDIYTTGSTADACSKVLFAAGAASVQVISFAAGANMMRFGSDKI